jgi:hypothetical protein
MARTMPGVDACGVAHGITMSRPPTTRGDDDMMKRVLPIAAVASVVAVPAAKVTANTPASGARTLAALECRGDRLDEPGEFRFKYGAGNAGLQRCIRAELRKARLECREDRFEEPYEFRAEYGTGRAAFDRCVRDKVS